MSNNLDQKKFSKYTVWLIGLLVATAIVVWVAIFQSKNQEGNLKVVFCDVGQGDAILIQIPDHEEILIDGGPDNSVLSCLGENMEFYDRKIGSIILTHPDADHITGLVEVLKRYEVEDVWMTSVLHENKAYAEFLNLIQEKHISVEITQTGDMVVQDESVKLKVLYPTESFKDKEVKDLNDTSIIVKLIYQNFSALFTGDLEENKQNEFFGYSSELKSKVLKVSHHGSKNGLSVNFLNLIQPEVAIISVGENNRYGHPAPEILKKLNEILDIKIYRTDKNGDIAVFSNGFRYWVETER